MSAILPGLSVLFAVIAAAVPWGLPGDATFILPLVTVMMVFCWRSIPDAILPPALAMALGLLTDVMSGGPLGFWALLSLIAASAGGLAQPLTKERQYMGLWLAWVGLVSALALLGWLLGSLYFFRWIDWWPVVFGAAASVVLFPVVLHGVLWLRRRSIETNSGAIYRRMT
jgi:rod shape-determining protein MreD